MYESSYIRTTTFQSFRRALHFENRTINKHVIGTFIITWSEILLNLVKSLIVDQFSKFTVPVKAKNKTQVYQQY